MLKNNLFVKFFSVLSISFILAACANQGLQPINGTDYANNQRIKILVMGEDGDKDSIIRTSNVFKRVKAALNESMHRYGFTMVDEEMLASQLGWRITTRRPKHELIEAAKLANGEPRADLQSRVLLLFRIYAGKNDLRFAGQSTIRVEGELYDLANNRYIGSFELPRITGSLPANCGDLCIEERVGDRARQIAAGIGDVLAGKLSYLNNGRPFHRGGKAKKPNLAHWKPAGDRRCGSASKDYTMEFNDFSTSEVENLMVAISNQSRNLADPFPCYRFHELLRGGNASLQRYHYQSSAHADKLIDWLHIVMKDEGFYSQYTIEFDGTERITLVKTQMTQESKPVQPPKPQKDYKFQ